MIADSSQEILISLDVECDGPIPGPWSMLSLGAAAFYPPSETPLSTFTVNLDRLAGSQMMHQGTQEFWRKFPKEFAATRERTQSPVPAMGRFVDWLRGLGGKPVALAYPLGFDWKFVDWYLWKFIGRNPLGLSGIDIKSVVWAMRAGRVPFHSTVKRTMPSEWFGEQQHAHIALDDAIEQGVMFMRILRDLEVKEERIDAVLQRR